jgi:hypothetical protein
MQACVVDRSGCPPRQLLRKAQVCLRVPPPRFGTDKRQGAERSALCEHRDHDERTDAERAHVAQMLRAAGAFHKHVLGQILDQNRLAGPDNHQHWIGIPRRILVSERERKLHLLRVAMGDSDTPYLTAGIEDVDTAPVCEGRQRSLRNPAQRGLVLERGRQDSAGFGEERGLTLRPFSLRTHLHLVFVQVRCAERGGSEVAESRSKADLRFGELAGPAMVKDDGPRKLPLDSERDREHGPNPFGAIQLNPVLHQRKLFDILDRYGLGRERMTDR